MREAHIQRIVAHHYPREAAASLRRPGKLAAFTHFVMLANETIPATLDDLLAETRRTYDGPSNWRGPHVVRDRRHNHVHRASDVTR